MNVFSGYRKKSGRNRKTSRRRMLRFERCEDRRMLSVVPAYSSNPSSLNKIFLDFDGHTVTDSYWTEAGDDTDGNNGNAIHAPVYNIYGDADYELVGGEWQALPFSQQELDYIKLAWEVIAEDFAPFDVDVTTDPEYDKPEYESWFTTGGANGEHAMRVLFTSYEDDGRLNGTGVSNDWVGYGWAGLSTAPEGPVADLAWNATTDRPVWVFANEYGLDGDAIIGDEIYRPNPDTGLNDWLITHEFMGGIASHEAGHGFGLIHDGVDPQWKTQTIQGRLSKLATTTSPAIVDSST